MPSVLFVCLGNICRSPLVEGVYASFFAKNGLSPSFSADSAATSTYHIGEHPHSGGQRCAKGHQIDISKHRARQVNASDFNRFDLIIGMDDSNMEDLQHMKRKLNPNGKAQIRMLSDFIPGQEGKEVPDAYYARDQAACFEEIYQMAMASIPALCEYLKKQWCVCYITCGSTAEKRVRCRSRVS